MKSKLLVAYTMRQYASLLLSVASFDMGSSSISVFLAGCNQKTTIHRLYVEAKEMRKENEFEIYQVY